MVRIKIFPNVNIKAWVRHAVNEPWQVGAVTSVDPEGTELDIAEQSQYIGPDRRRASEIAIQLHEDRTMTMREYLALDRTIMANEQSLLSYLRTGLAFAAGGAALLHWERTQVLAVVGGVVLIGIGLATILVGFARFNRMQKILEKVKHLGLEHVSANHTSNHPPTIP